MKVAGGITHAPEGKLHFANLRLRAMNFYLNRFLLNSFLNGKYLKQVVDQSIFWGWKNLNSLKQVRMMIRQKGV